MNNEQYGRMDAKLDHIVIKVDQLDDTINGNGTVGLVVKTDRNTQSLSIFKKLFWIVTTALVTSGVAAAIILAN